MNFDINKVNKTDVSPNDNYIGLGKNKHTIDCIDCDNCEYNGKWIPNSGINNDCNCDCKITSKPYRSSNCNCDCSDDCLDSNCYVDDDNWYPGGSQSLFGLQDCECNCVCNCNCVTDNCDLGDGVCNLSDCNCDCQCDDCNCDY